jgi:hypothetical protein
LGSAFSSRVTIADGDESIIYEINVPQGASELEVSIDAPATKAADVDLYLYSCAKECELKALSTRSGVREQVTVTQPKGGKWKVVIDPVSIPSGTLTLDYTDVFAHPAFGFLTPLRSNVGFAKGTNADTQFAAKIDALPLNSRRLVGLAQLMTPEPVTVRYEYNPATKTVEPIKERVMLAEALLELQREVLKMKPLSGAARR